MNNVIWIYWHDGWENAPEIVLKCLETWELKNSGWAIKKLCRNTLPAYIHLNKELPGYESKNITLTSLSDVIRILLLEKYGGVWVDSTVFCRMPLNDWKSIFYENDFFAFSKPANDRLVSSWFLAAKKGNYIVQKWKEKTLEYWRSRSEVKEYFWFHYLFNELYASDLKFKGAWDDTPKMSADAPHYFLPYEERFFEQITDEKKRLIHQVQSPVFKLTYKYDTGRGIENTVLGYLMNSNGEVVKRKMLVAWYGSFFQNGTVGDYLAVNSLTRFLEENNFEFDCASYKAFEGLKGKTLTLDEIIPEQYDVIIFCCGPILKNHPHLSNLFEKFKHAYKIGISVSLLPQDHFNYYNPFDYVLARENNEINYEDIAVLAVSTFEKKRHKRGRITVGLALRNEQFEYGVENCKYIEANGYIKKLADKLTEKKEAKVNRLHDVFRDPNKAIQQENIIEIENHLERSHRTPSEIEGLYNECDIILTTRFHGSILALRNNIPFIAIDQIENGAKVYGLVSQTGYPFVWKINDVSYEKLEVTAEELLSGKYDNELRVAKLNAEAKAKMSLKQLHSHLLSCIISKK
jgi:hypothetical protein